MCVCVCVCVFFFLFFVLVRKVIPRESWTEDGVQFRPRLSISTALTLTWRTTKEHRKNGPLRKQPRPHIGKRKDPGDEVGYASCNTNRPRCIGQARRSPMRTPELRGETRRAVSLGGATLGPVPSLLSLNRSFSVACPYPLWKTQYFVMEVCWWSFQSELETMFPLEVIWFKTVEEK